MEFCHKDIVQYTVQSTADHDDNGSHHCLALSDDEDAQFRLQEDGQGEGTEHRVVRPQVFDVSVRRAAQSHDGIREDQADGREKNSADDRKVHHSRKGLTGFLSLTLTDFPDDDRVAAAADHDSYRDIQTDDRIVKIDGTDRHLTDIALDEQSVHHLVYTDEHKDEDARRYKLQQ